MSLNSFFKVTGITKQAFHAKLDRSLAKRGAFAQLELVVSEVRKDHPGMNLRDLYLILAPDFIGRDAFESHFLHMGYGVQIKKAFRRTTDSSGVVRFDNLVDGIELNDVNQVWVSDITYYRIGDMFYYITFVMDLFSRLIVGHAVSRGLRTEMTTLPALKCGLKTRSTRKLPGLVFHSDGGGQYYSMVFRALTTQAEILNSMGVSVYENPNAERLNGVIKNNYIRHYAPKNYDQLVRVTAKAVRMYNTQKPHSSLNKMNPVAFENKIRCLRKKESVILY
ncbi:MAG: DDE-type integrase/transposase/recombinase [Gelidibacter sp.]